MRGLFLAVSLILTGISYAQEGGAPPPIPAQKPAAPTSFIAQGEAVEIPDAGFTITPPIGWEVQRNTTGASLLFEAPKVEGAPGVVTFQPSIRIMTINEPRPIDDMTKEEYSEIIQEKNSALGGVSNFNIRSADKVTLQNGVEGFLYYTEFTLGSTPMMQMHILVSSETKHFLMTYLDLASVFETEGSPALATAYTSMQSVVLDSKPADRFAKYYVWGGVALALIVFLIFLRVMRGYKMKRLGEQIESDDSGDSSAARDDDDDDLDVSAVAPLNDDDNEMPETREARKPAAKAAPISEPARAPSSPRVSSPAPAPVAPVARPSAPVAASVPVPAPAPAPRGEFGENERSERTKVTAAPKAKAPSQHDEDEDDNQPMSEVAGGWNMDSDPTSDISEIKPKASLNTKKAKPQKVSNPAKMKDVAEDASEVARLSEILPNTGDSKKKKGFFGWGKGKDKDKGRVEAEDDFNDNDDDFASVKGKGHIGDEDSWDEESKAAKSGKKGKKAKDDDEAPMSEVAGWNLKNDKKSASFDDDDDDKV